ncbi:hypothetical protein L195_g034207, partial [Trifolium pratense]
PFDGIDMLIKGLSLATLAIYTPLMQRSQVRNLPPIHRSGRWTPPEKVDSDPGIRSVTSSVKTQSFP